MQDAGAPNPVRGCEQHLDGGVATIQLMEGKGPLHGELVLIRVVLRAASGKNLGLLPALQVEEHTDAREQHRCVV